MSPLPVRARPIVAFVFVHVMLAPGTLLTNVKLTALPGQKAKLVTAVTTGSGFTVIENTIAGPEHPFRVAITLILATMGTPELLMGAVYAAMLPALKAGRPIAVLLLVQLNTSLPPVFAENGIAATEPPEHTTTLVTVLTIGVGRMVIVNDLIFVPELVHPRATPLTVTVPVIFAPVLLAGAVYEIFPLPLKASPMAGLVFVQFRVAPATLLASGIPIVAPGQKAWFETAATTGSGFTVIVKSNESPPQAGVVALTGTMEYTMLCGAPV
jgi:hypothetical protein